MYQGDVKVRGVKEAAQDAKRKNGRESAGLRELMSRKFGLATTLSRVMYRADLGKLIAGRPSHPYAASGQSSRPVCGECLRDSQHVRRQAVKEWG